MFSRLKSLELHGYKTFANRTYFEFSEKITAIVGPNGSGKSNIADSLRWVLGEQSYHLLRGKKTEDMIFSGSELRPRSGMASATVTFDNSDGWLPIDFSEVAITRRAYRDGENEYLINGQRMRLRDVSELLSNSGLAERTYTIIGQGLVDAALSLKAEERRRLFEEAAGIGLLRSRREEALRRLDTTQRNLDRVQDILAELQPRLNSLERQARRAQEYDQIKSDLRVVLHDWYGYHWHHAQQELAESRRVMRLQDKVLENSRKEQKLLDGNLREMRVKIQGIRQELNGWHRQLSQLHIQREQSNLDLAVAEERHRSIDAQKLSLQTDLLRLEEDSGLQRERLLIQSQDLAHLETELAEAEEQLKDARTELSKLQTEKSNAETSLRLTNQTIQEKISRYNQLQAQIKETKSRLDQDRQAMETSLLEIASLEGEYQVQEKISNDHSAEQRDAQAALKAAELKYQDFENHVTDLENQLNDRKKELSDAINTLSGMKTQLRVLEQANLTLEGYSSGTRLLLRAAQEKRLKGVRSTFLNDLIVPVEYELAISAALGDMVQAVLVDEQVDEALDLLLDQSVRGVIIPLANIDSNLHGGQLEEICQNTGLMIGRAADLIQVPAELHSVIELLLGHVYLVENRLSARKLLEVVERNPSEAVQNLRIVTLDGQVFQPRGLIQVNAAKSDAGDHSLLGRQRSQRALFQEIDRVEKENDSLEERIDHFEKQLTLEKSEGERLRVDVQECRKQYQQAILAADRARLALEQAQRQVAWRTNQRENLQEEIAQREAIFTLLTQEISEIEQEIQPLQVLAQEQQASLSLLTTNDAQEKVNHWNTTVLLAQRSLNEARSRHHEMEGSLQRLLQQEKDTQQRYEALEASQRTLTAQKQSTQENFHKVGEKIALLQKLIEPSEANLELLEAEQEKLQGAEALARQALNLAEHHSAQARIAHTRSQEALQSLRGRIEEDFGLVAFEYEEQVSGPNPLPLDGMVEKLPVIDRLAPEVEESLRRLQAQLRRIGPINPEAQAEYNEVSQRHTFLKEQISDLEKAEADVRQVIKELDTLMEQEFNRTFAAVAEEFKSIFTRLFGGGSARLLLSDPDDLTNTGIEIEARLPGRRTQGLVLLSGGERSLTAAALIFALIKVSPTPFCLLDEVDAMLDEANVGRFRELLGELSQLTQFIIVTHNRNTVQAADVIYGVTMGRDSSSQVISLKLDQVPTIVD